MSLADGTTQRTTRLLIVIVGFAAVFACANGINQARADIGDSDRLGYQAGAPELIVRNLVEGRPIPVCSTDFPNATQQAIMRWNDALEITAFVMLEKQDDCHVVYRDDWHPKDGVVRITVSRGTEDNSRYYGAQLNIEELCEEQPIHPVCVGMHRGESLGYAGFDNMFQVRTLANGQTEIVYAITAENAAWQSYFGRGEVVINPYKYGCDIDVECSDDQTPLDLVLLITHELGHLLGLADYFCEAWQPWLQEDRVEPDTPTVMNSWNLEMQCYPSDGLPTELDREDYRTAYLPAAVTEIVAEADDVGHVRLYWDQSDVFVEADFVIQRMVGAGWLDIGTAPANAESTTLSRQPSGQQRYRIVGRTKALPSGPGGSGYALGAPSMVVAIDVPVSLFVAPVITSFIAVGDELQATFSWQGTAPRYLDWELYRSTAQDRGFALHASLPMISGALAEFDNQERGYWYKLRGRACEVKPVDELFDASGEQTGPTFEICGDWSMFSPAVEIAPLGICVPSGGPFGAAGATGAAAACIPDGAAFRILPHSIETTRNSVEFGWTESVGATTYEVRVRQAGSDQDIQSETLVDEATRSYRFGGLQPATDYVVGVRGANEFGASDWVDASATTLAECTLTVTAGTGGTVSGGGTGDCGRIVTISATPDASYAFSHWSGGASGSQNPLSGSLRSNLTLHANFIYVPPPPPTCGPQPPRPPDDTQTIDVGDETRWVASGSLEIEERRDILQNQVRSVVWRGLPDCEWVWGPWQNVGGSYWGSWAATGNQRCQVVDKPSGSRTETIDTQFRWVVRGNTAHQQSREQRQRYEWETDWEGVPTCSWVEGRWEAAGLPSWTGWSDTGVTDQRPETRTVILPEVQTESRTEVTFTSPGFCVERTYERVVGYEIRVITTYSWNNGAWVGSTNMERHVVSHGPWQLVSTAPCDFGGGSGPQGAGEFLLPAGDYVLEWNDTRIAFTVPEGASISLRWRLESDAYVAVFRNGDAEMVVTAQALNAPSGQDTPDDPTLASLAASLRSAEPEEPAATEGAQEECSVVAKVASGATSVDLDADPCVVVRDGGALRVDLGGTTRPLTLVAGRDWLLVATAGADQALAIAIVDLSTGGYLVIRVSDGAELSRHVPSGVTDLSTLFDTIVVDP